MTLLAKTFSFILFRVGILLLQLIVYALSVVLAVAIGSSFIERGTLLFSLLQFSFVATGLGMGAFFQLYVFAPLNWYINKMHIIATTVVALELEYEGNLIRYSHKQASSNLLQTATTNILSTKGVAAVINFKRTILEKDIFTLFLEPKTSAGRLVQKIVLNNIEHTLDTIPDIMVSYVWLTSDLYEKYGKPNNKKTSIGKRAKNQAKFAMEGLGLYVRVLPKLFISSVFQQVALEFLSVLIVTALNIAHIVIFGFNWWSLILWFFTHKLIHTTITDIFYNTLRINLVIRNFYKALHGVKPLSNSDLAGMVGKIPALGFIAKRSGVDELKECGETEDYGELGAGQLIDEKEVLEEIRKQINDVCKVFQFTERDLLKEVSDSPQEDQEEAQSEPEQNQEEQPSPEEPEQQPDGEPEEELPEDVQDAINGIFQRQTNMNDESFK